MKQQVVRGLGAAALVAALLFPSPAFAREQQRREDGPAQRIVKILKKLVPTILQDFPSPPKP